MYEGKHIRIPDFIRERIRDKIMSDMMFYYNETNTIFSDDFLFGGKPDRKQYHGFCTHCNTWAALDGKPKHGERVLCPNCYHEVELRAGGRGRKGIKERKFVRAFSMPNPDTLHIYEIYVERENFTDYEYNHEAQYEDIRTARLHVVDKDGWKAYDCGYYGEPAKKMKNPKLLSYSKASGLCFCFGYYETRSIHFLEPDFRLEQSPIKYITECIGTYFDDWSWWERLGAHLRYPFLEQLNKAGYMRLWENIISGRKSRYINPAAKSWSGFIRCGDKALKAKLRKALKINREIGVDTFEKAASIMKDRADFLPEYADMLSDTEMKIYYMLESFGSKRIYNYLQTHDSRIWHDYLKMAHDTGTDLTKKSSAFPKDLTAEHDRLVERLSAAKYGRYENDVAARYAKFCAAGIELYRHGGLVAHAPTHAMDIVIEGQHMNNCVATYTRDHAEGLTTIFFVRRENSPHESYFTLELALPAKKGDEIEVEQCYGYGNKVCYTKNLRVKQFVEKFIKHINYCNAHKTLAKKYHGKDVDTWKKLQERKPA